MTVARPKGPKGKADTLCKQIVHARGVCERCGTTTGLQWAHIVKRTYASTRTDPENAWCLCGTCHYETGTFPDQFMALVIRTIGRTKYEELCRRAKDGVNVKVDWAAEVERLKQIRAEMDERAAW